MGMGDWTLVFQMAGLVGLVQPELSIDQVPVRKVDDRNSASREVQDPVMHKPKRLFIWWGTISVANYCCLGEPPQLSSTRVDIHPVLTLHQNNRPFPVLEASDFHMPPVGYDDKSGKENCQICPPVT